MNIFKTYFSYLKKVWSAESEGFGDTVKKITSTFGIHPCEGCERRRKKFNEAIKYRKKIKEIKEVK
jgi:hypothetical protein